MFHAYLNRVQMLEWLANETGAEHRSLVEAVRTDMDAAVIAGDITHEDRDDLEGILTYAIMRKVNAPLA